MTDEEKPDHLALHGKHAAMEARFGPEASHLVPLSYASPLEEVQQAHRDIAICDVSSLTRLRISGDQAPDLLERLCTHDVARQEDDTAQLTCLCRQDGGILDCGYLYRMENHWLLTGDAGNRAKLLEHVNDQASDFDVKIKDQTDRSCQFWVTGREAPRQLDELLGRKISDLEPGEIRSESYLVAKIVVSRTGYGPLWSLEAIVPGLLAGQAWQFLTSKAKDKALKPLGYVARDILRIEAGLPRYGHEINEMVDPFTAGLDRCVDLDHDFIGAEALTKRKANRTRKPMCLTLLPTASGQAPLIPRMGADVRSPEGDTLGTVTSGTFSPTRDAVVALACLLEHVQPGQAVQVRRDQNWFDATTA
jgi:aminomethyltransferase